ncbi:MAG: phenylalanine--tRNA ligase subunit alpha, partial [Bacteroidales bacterium]|nr:phenylalanine--tRNA ligase subunit alpha [Bacteroidales bacterium]
MIDDKIIEDLQKQIDELKAASQQQVEEIRVKMLGKKGEITRLFEE